MNIVEPEGMDLVWWSLYLSRAAMSSWALPGKTVSTCRLAGACNIGHTA